MSLVRLPDWVARLNAWVAANRTRPFAWGEWDCVVAAADMAREITGTDVLGRRWTSQPGAMRALKAAGGLKAAVTGCLGDPIGVAFAQRGDVVLIEDEALSVTPGGMIAVCTGEHVVAPARDGLVFFPVSCAAQAWRVGRD